MRKGRIAREDRVSRAKVRLEAREKRNPQQQLNFLDTKLGKEIGAQKERNRLLREINQVSPDSAKSEKIARTRAARRKEKAERHARRQRDGN